MSIFQVIAVIFALFMIYVVRVKSRKYHLCASEVVVWYILWVGFAFLALFPNTLLGFAHLIKFARVFDLLIVIAFMALTMITTFLYFKVKEFDQKIEQLTRDKALRAGK